VQSTLGVGGRGREIFASATCSLQFAKASAATLSHQEKNDAADVQRGRLHISYRPQRRTMRPSRWRSRTRPTPLAPRLMPLALMWDSVTRPHVSPSYACFLFAARPAKDGDVSDVVRILMRLLKHCSDNASIYRFWARPTTMATCWLRSNTRAGPPWRGWRARLRTATSQCRRSSRSRWPSTWPTA